MDKSFERQEMEVDGVMVACEVLGGEEEISKEEAQAYINRYREKHPDKTLARLDIVVPGGKGSGDVELTYITNTQPFERIRRITGYLVGDMNR